MSVSSTDPHNHSVCISSSSSVADSADAVYSSSSSASASERPAGGDRSVSKRKRRKTERGKTKGPCDAEESEEDVDWVDEGEAENVTCSACSASLGFRRGEEDEITFTDVLPGEP
eukprot:GHVQ01029025.1.p1 GENE.GHVQ01029025.1~~GHVQ01029025.1.p1  ORF type:complete len:115 (+),score=32.75 GHVQ01029025.1:397-741(+)